MKTYILTTGIVCALTASAFSASVAGSNLIEGDGSDWAIVDNAGNAIGVNSGIAAGGFFRTLTDAQVQSTSISDISSLIADFEIVTSDNFNAFNTAGLYAFDSGSTTLTGVVGTSLYTFFGNNIELATSSEFGLYLSTEEIDVDLVTSPDSNNLPFPQAGGTAIFGSDSRNGPVVVDATGVGLGNNFETASFTLEAVPEPSSTALLGLGGLALIIRRRR